MIEPTEEQKQAANAFVLKTRIAEEDSFASAGLARLLAEREAKLRKQLTFMEAGSLADYNAFAEALQKEDAYLAEINLINERLAEMREVDGRKSRMLYDRDVVIDTLRARVAELEAEVSESTRLRMTETLHGMGVEAMHQEREAQHLADIKALKSSRDDAVQRAVDLFDEYRRAGFVSPHPAVDLGEAFHLDLDARLAHYDDAKAVCVVDGCEKPRETAFRCCDHVIDGDIGVAWSDDAKADAAAVDMQAWANGSCPEPGCSLANPHEQGVACVKPTAEGGAR